MDEIERVLGVPCSPVNWPLGSGTAFIGVYDRWSNRLVAFERVDGGGAHRVPHARDQLGRPELVGQRWAQAELARMPRRAGAAGDRRATPSTPSASRPARSRPVFFGSAMNNFGLEPFLDRFVELAPPPRTRNTSLGPLRARRPGLLGLRVQDPGEHGSPAPRPDRLRAHLLGTLHPGHGGASTCAPARPWR